MAAQGSGVAADTAAQIGNGSVRFKNSGEAPAAVGGNFFAAGLLKGFPGEKHLGGAAEFVGFGSLLPGFGYFQNSRRLGLIEPGMLAQPFDDG